MIINKASPIDLRDQKLMRAIKNLSQFEFALLNLRHPGFEHSVETAQHFLMRLLDDPNFEQRYSRDDVYLFKHK